MTRLESILARARGFAGRAAVLGLAVCFWLLTSPVAWAAKKKAVVVVEKSYVMPYMIVIAVIAVGLMTVCRPSRRLDKPDDKHRKDEQD